MYDDCLTDMMMKNQDKLTLHLNNLYKFPLTRTSSITLTHHIILSPICQVRDKFYLNSRTLTSVVIFIVIPKHKQPHFLAVKQFGVTRATIRFSLSNSMRFIS